jgi:hypothetical protein
MSVAKKKPYCAPDFGSLYAQNVQTCEARRFRWVRRARPFNAAA